MNEPKSKRHHYIPKFYLDGFVIETNRFYIFDKIADKIFESSPKASFVENNRNTSIVGDEKSTLLEDMFSYYENDIAPYLKKLRNTTHEYNLYADTDTLVALINFIHLMYWRLPNNEENLNRLIDEMTFEEAGFHFINENTGKPDTSREFEDRMKSKDLFRKMYHIFFMRLSSEPEFRKNGYYNWNIYYRCDNNQITSDNPIILEKFIDFSSLNEELIFPISMNKVLFHTKKDKPLEISHQFFLELDLLLLLQATRFVCCYNKSYLENLVSNYKRIGEKIGSKELTEHIFCEYFQ